MFLRCFFIFIMNWLIFLQSSIQSNKKLVLA
nr:MAG TPA: hypothetical protein [Caudoviricetes sp.]